ncbi:flagellar hook protein FlgE [Desulfosarcina alkanivorans]|jgi:flagellar hook protein FlgE|uniref:Flagellar hook protein FlgE n=1 Tax=Desulfosarcina alkanivorans TaxID=571177 RepID=A0A5K7YE98_9BACT|nr:flagellar hook protein FlgE [Desulfosarcina alkanivorans]BBO66765.1 flagellar hook protein FlgE [Desulfosarcina alkanivorans]
MIGSLYSGISGLKANTSAMAVIGDNIANVDTTGFKSSRVSFANIFSSSLSQTNVQIGRGVFMNSVNPQWESGSLENTNSATDLSVNGSGMFIVADPNSGTPYYTRAGKFDWNSEGNLVTPDGFLVQGIPIDPDGVRGSIGDIVLPNGTSDPNPTSNIAFGLNLSNDAAVGDTFTSSITTYDSLGSEVILDIVFTRNSPGWDWVVNPDVGASATTGHIEFDSDGNLDPAASFYDPGTGAVYADPVIDVTGLGGANDLGITWTYLDAGASDGSITGYSGESTKTAQSQDGYPSGSLQTVAVDEDGYFTGIYSNGSMIPFAQLSLADFASYAGLAKQGSNLYAESLSSGQPLVGPPNTAGLGSVAPSTLEMSNVDLGTEFVEMITTQRAFQANSKVITTSDEILSELLNIKR